MRAARPPLAEPSASPKRARSTQTWRPHPDTIPDGPATPPAARYEHGQPWNLHGRPREIAPALMPAASDRRRHTTRDLLWVRQQKWPPSTPSLRGASHGMRAVSASGRTDERACPARACTLTAPLPRSLGWRWWSASLRRLVPPLTPSCAQVDHSMYLAICWPGSGCRARRRARGARRERARMCGRTRDGGARACVGPGSLCAVWTAPGNDLGRARCARAGRVRRCAARRA